MSLTFSYSEGVLVECDPSIKAIISRINDQHNHEFIVEDIDDEHVLIKNHKLDELKLLLKDVCSNYQDLWRSVSHILSGSKRYRQRSRGDVRVGVKCATHESRYAHCRVQNTYSDPWPMGAASLIAALLECAEIQISERAKVDSSSAIRTVNEGYVSYLSSLQNSFSSILHN